jgi:hypothetical protein
MKNFVIQVIICMAALFITLPLPNSAFAAESLSGSWITDKAYWKEYFIRGSQTQQQFCGLACHQFRYL